MALLTGSFLTAYAPLFLYLARGPWQTEQEGHGPLIIAGSLWLAWQARARIRTLPPMAAPLAGWVAVLCGLLLMFLSRIQGLPSGEVLSAVVVIAGSIVLLAGWPTLRAVAFAVGFLLFAVPLPEWISDGATVPLKVFISDAVTQLLHAAGYPVAQNGVMIMIGAYEVLVKDACSGMNSIVALAAVGVFYAHEVHRNSPLRIALLLLAAIPIAIAANFVRVLALILIAYYQGVDALAGNLHGLTGIALFAVALVLFLVFDGTVSFAARLVHREARH